MKPVHYILIALALLLLFLSIKYWSKITEWWNTLKDGDKCVFAYEPVRIEGVIKNGLCVPKQQDIKKDCNQEYKEAEAEWAKNGKSCIMTIEEWVCPYDKSYTVQVNPCVGKILERKGWKLVNGDENPSANNNVPASSSGQLQVYNSNGAFMYYQTDLASGGKLYSKSNVLVPYGTKFNMIKFWQTSPNNTTLKGFYETDYKQYGANGGFFELKDIKKI